MHKNPHQNAGNGIKATLFFKIFLGSMPPDPPEVLAPSARVGQIRVRPPPQISKPVRLCIHIAVSFAKGVNYLTMHAICNCLQQLVRTELVCILTFVKD